MNIGLKILGGALCFAATTPAVAQSREWTISEANGRVVVEDAKGSHTATRGMVVSSGATVTTAAGSRAVMVRGPEFVTVSASSRVRVPEAAQQAGIFQILQDWGNAMFRIDKQPKPHFGVKTPYLAAVVKGTTFSITVGAEGASMQVVEGAVEVSTDDGGARDLVRPGSVAMVAAGDRYRLTVKGEQSRVIDSPARPAPVEGAAAATPTTGVAVIVPAGNPVESNVIATAIEAKPVDLGSVTGGMIRGSSPVIMASVAITPATVGTVFSSSSTRPIVEGNSTTAELVAPVVATQVRTDSDALAAADTKASANDAGKADHTTKDAEKDAAKAAKDADKDAAKAAEDAQKAADKAAKDAEKAADDAKKAADKAANDADKDAAKAADDAQKAADKAAKDAEKAADDSQKAADKAAKDADKDAAKAADDAKKAADKAAQDAEKDAAKAADDAQKAADKAAKDAAKAAEDAKKEAEKAAKDALKDLKGEDSLGKGKSGDDDDDDDSKGRGNGRGNSGRDD